MPTASKCFSLFVMSQFITVAMGAQFWASGCTATLNGGTRNCCPSTGLCQDSSCTVFGFKNSAKSNCHVSGANPNCPDIQCNWVIPGCPLVSDGNHCYGYAGCKTGTTCSNPLVGSLCLEDGGSANFKVCGKGSSCNNDKDCIEGTCQGTGQDKECVVPDPSPSRPPSRSPLASPTASASRSPSPQRSPLASPSTSPEDVCEGLDLSIRDNYSNVVNADAPQCGFAVVQAMLQEYQCIQDKAECNILRCNTPLPATMVKKLQDCA